MLLGLGGLWGHRARAVALAATLLALHAETPAQAAQGGESHAADAATIRASDALLAALRQWERAPDAARMGLLVQRAQQRQEQLVALARKNPRLAAARLLPAALASRLPAQAAAFAERAVSLEGRVYAHVADDIATGVSRADFKLQPAAGGAELALHLADAAGSNRDLRSWAGKQVSLKATQLADQLLILDRKQVRVLVTATTSGNVETMSIAAAQPVIQGVQNTLAILVNFTDKAMSCTPADVASRLFGDSGATVNNNYRESSRGLVGFSGQVIGPFTINYASTDSCTYLGWGAAAEAAAKAAGVDPALYARVSYVTPPNASCGWKGMAFMPGRQSWVQSCAVTGAFSHELGHNLSFDHAATPTFEYGDTSDPMGGSQMVGHHAANRVMAGWMPAGSVLDVGTGGSYALATLSTNAPAAAPQVLRIAKPDSGEYYYISLRQALNLDAYLPLKYVGTLSVHRASGTLPAETMLLQNLGAGQSFADSANGITITNQGVAGGIATVNVSFGGATCVRNAPQLSVAPASQSAAAGSAVTYLVNVTNNDSAACGLSTFGLSQALPTGFSGSFANPSLGIAAGATGASNWTVVSASTLADATYALAATATGSASGLSGSAPASHVVYTAPSCIRATPQLSITPSLQSGNAGTTLVYTVNVANRNGSGCGASAFNLSQALPGGFNAAFAASTLSVAPGASASTHWSVGSASTLAAGSYTIEASAVEATSGASAGSASATDVVNRTIADTTPPTVAFTSPSADATLSGKTLTLVATASDASGVHSVAFYVDGKLLATDASPPYTANWNLNKAARGIHTLTVRATDNAGNVAEQSIVVRR